MLRLVSVLGPAILYWYHFSHSGIRIQTQTSQEDSVATNFLKLLTLSNEVDPIKVRAVDVSLILYAEHDFAASTFAARTTASTLADIHSCLTTGVATLKGKLHGGANEAAMHLLQGLPTT